MKEGGERRWLEFGDERNGRGPPGDGFARDAEGGVLSVVSAQA